MPNTLSSHLKSTLFTIERAAFRSGVYGRGFTLPDFLNIGPGQSGTTWLFEKLGSHPQVHLPAMKETYYFSRNFNQWSLHYYASLFQCSSGQISGEITPGYGILKRARIREVYRLLPQARLFMTVRNPVERSWSGIRRVLGKLGKTVHEVDRDTLLAWLDQEWMYQEDDSIAVTGEYEPGLMEGNYTQCIDNWLEVFPEESLLVMFFDELVNDPSQFLVRVCEHLGIRHEELPDQENLQVPVNKNPAAQMPVEIREFLTAKYRDEIGKLQDRYGGPSLHWL